MKMMFAKFKKTLLIGLIAISMAGCVTTDCPTMPPKPSKPTLASMERTPEGGIKISRDDAEKLGIYILELERGYQL